MRHFAAGLATNAPLRRAQPVLALHQRAKSTSACASLGAHTRLLRRMLGPPWWLASPPTQSRTLAPIFALDQLLRTRSLGSNIFRHAPITIR